MNEETPVTTTKTEQQMRRRMKWIVSGVVIISIAIIIAIFVLLINGGAIDEARDFVIIWLALEMLAIGGAILFLLYQVIKLIKLLRDELIPLIRSAQETVNSARGTTTYVGRKIVEPTAKAAATAARLQTMMRVLFKGK